MKRLANTLMLFFGHEVTLQVVNPSRAIRLPALTKQHLEFYTTRLPYRADDLLIIRCQEQFTPRIIKSMYAEIKKQLAGLPLLYFDKLPTRDKQQLIKARVQFIVGDSFLYAPLIGICGESRDFVPTENNLVKRFELTPTAETILIGQILDARFSGALGNEIAKAICVTPAAASQALQELEKHGLVSLVRTGKGKSAEFEERSFIWQTGLKLLRNPVEKEMTLDSPPPTGSIRAGLSALADSSMLVEPDIPVWAIHKHHFANLKSMPTLPSSEIEKQYILQIWRRDPLILSQEGKIDPISLYLSLQKESDERIKKELLRVLEKLDLEVPHDNY